MRTTFNRYHWYGITLVLVFALGLAGCVNNAEVSISYEDRQPTELGIRYGDGEWISLRDENKIATIMNLLSKNTYVKQTAPDAAGYLFTITIEPDEKFSSNGFLNLNSDLYKAQNEELTAEIIVYVKELRDA